MSEYVKVKKSDLLDLIEASSDVRDLLDDVHCYDTPQYYTLSKVLSLSYEDIEE